VGGVWFFGGRLPREVTLQLELPPFVLAAGERLPREAFGAISGTVTAGDGVAVATFATRAAAGPLAGPVALRLREGPVVVRVLLPDQAGAPALRGSFEVRGDGEARVDLRAERP
jgi:hypothetical protein